HHVRFGPRIGVRQRREPAQDRETRAQHEGLSDSLSLPATRRMGVVPLRRLLGLALLPLAMGAPTGPGPVRPIPLRSCEAAGIAARCGSLEVYENRQTKVGRRIALHVVVVPATDRTPAPDPVFWLEGGPGGAATDAIGPVSQQYLRGLRRTRDLVF